MKILVTGGFGFLGGHLVELLLADKDNTIHVVDNLCTNPLPLEDFLDDLGHQPGLTYSIETVETYCRSFKSNEQRYDEIYHLASVVGPAGVLPHAGRIAASIINDTLAVADITMRCNARLLDVSTSEIYGGGQEGFCSETMPKIVQPHSSARLEYAVGKLAAETALINLHRTKGLEVRIVRPFNISGPRQSGKGGFVLPRFIEQALSGADITVFGDGSQIRAFTHVKDMVEGIVCVMKNGRIGEAYNLGNPENRCTILQLAQDVQRVTESVSKLVFVDPKTIYGPFYEEANNKFPDARKAMSDLGWRAHRDRRRVITDTFQYINALHRGSVKGDMLKKKRLESGPRPLFS